MWTVGGPPEVRDWAIANVAGWYNSWENNRPKAEVEVDINPLTYERIKSFVPAERIHPQVHAQAAKRQARHDLLNRAVAHPQHDRTDRWPDLFPAQVDGINFLLAAQRAALIYTVGRGKTATAGAAARLVQEGRGGIAVVVCPKQPMHDWANELITRVESDWRVRVVEGSPMARFHIINDAEPGDLLILNWELLTRHPELFDLDISVLIGDEIQRLGNRPRTVGADKKKVGVQTEAFQKLAAGVENVYLASGTPTDGNAAAWYSILRTLDPWRFTSYSRFEGMFVDTVMGWDNRYKMVVKDNGMNGLKNVDIFTKILEAYTISRDFEPGELPPTEREVITIEMAPKHRKLYDQVEQEAFALVDDTGVYIDALNAMGKELRLRQLTSCTYIFSEEIADEKVSALANRVAQVPAEDNVLVFTTFVNRYLLDGDVLAFLADVVGRVTGREVLTIRGGMKARDIFAISQRLRHETNLAVVVSTSAGGTGLNLQGANWQFYLDRDWSLIKNIQAEGRVRRPGQTKTVHIIDLAYKDTVDQVVREVVARKEPVHNLTFASEVIHRRKMQREQV